MSESLKRDYNIGPEIGRGRFGTVYRCSSSATGEPFAVKSVDKSLITDPIDRACIEREAKVAFIAAAGNRGVVGVHAVYEEEEWVHIVMDLCSDDLFERISRRGGSIQESEAATVMRPLMEALSTCHRRGVIHRDVKPENILFDGEGRLRLADFGSAMMTGDVDIQDRGLLVGTPYYVAPEVVAGREYGEKVDVWSAGVVMYVMLAGAPPFSGETAAEIFEAVLRGNLRFPSRLFREVSSAAKDLMRKMLCKEVVRRFSADQVMRHPWMMTMAAGQLESADMILN